MGPDFDEYAEARTGALLRLAYLLSGDPNLAEDLVQEALERAHRRWARIAQVEDPHAYVRRIVVNQHLSWRRRRARSEVVLPADRMPDVATGDAQDAHAVRDLVWRRIQELPVRPRTVLVLRYYEDVADSDIADVLGVAPGTVRSLASRAFARLRAHPELSDYAPSAPAPVHSEETS